MLVKTKFKNLHFAPNMLLKMHQLRNADDKLEYARQCMHSAEKRLKSRKAQVKACRERIGDTSHKRPGQYILRNAEYLIADLKGIDAMKTQYMWLRRVHDLVFFSMHPDRFNPEAALRIKEELVVYTTWRSNELYPMMLHTLYNDGIAKLNKMRREPKE